MGNGNMTLNRLYDRLIKAYGPQGWWPLYSVKKEKSVYEGRLPRMSRERFEIAAGAVMTQSVSWKNVERALSRLKQEKLLSPEGILEASHERIAELIRPVGYYNQKTIKLKSLAEWFLERGVKTSFINKLSDEEFRHELLSIRGVGPETADAILLYAYDVESFVVDAYTKRILARLGIIGESGSYEQVRALFHDNFKGGSHEYREYHALFVEHGKRHCAKKPLCRDCFLSRLCTCSQKL